jgi:cytochrome c5
MHPFERKEITEMKKWAIATVFFLLTCLFFIHQESEATMTDRYFVAQDVAEAPSQTSSPKEGSDLIVQGKAEYHEKCSACHEPKDPQSTSAAEWTETINSKGCAFENVELTDAQKESILRYLTSVAK